MTAIAYAGGAEQEVTIQDDKEIVHSIQWRWGSIPSQLRDKNYCEWCCFN